ncbi:dolichyl-phosphate-mannose-protein mannosyltransferase [Nocardia puris]|uniref:Dolichyl-phosphate-mannose-protein mannosyltransferase n=1 Tax=Nocardia puris TaxID=208602 RepID=A0A366DW54_9NOCA|nr:dolichyl-phosphate-mannose-protein mannosyltransferase [Nocardia puris]
MSERIERGLARRRWRSGVSDSGVRAESGVGERPPVATGGLSAVAAASTAVLAFAASRYDYFGDELYFLAAGRHPSFGYADQGPVLPMLARLMDALAPDSYFALRLPAVALTVLAVVLTGLVARELGGGRTAQMLAATAYATSPFLLLQGKLLTTNAVDTVMWVVITWCVVRWVRTRRDGLLLAAALVTAVDMQVKWLIPFFWLAVAASALVFGPRDLVRRPLLWVGGALVVLATLPTLIWQARHDWPQLRMGGVISGEQDILGGRLMFVPLAVLTAGTLGAVVLVYGVWALLRNPSLREYRFLGVAFLLVTLVFLIVGGRVYYMAGMYGVVLAAGAVGLVELATESRPFVRRFLTAGGTVLTVGSVVFVLWATPWQSPEDIAPPIDDTEAALNIDVYGQFGWPELVDGVTAAYAKLTPAEREDVVVVTDTYWQASALDQFARHELPAIYSPSRGYGYFGTPPDDATAVLAVGVDEDFLRWNFERVEALTKVDSRLGFPGSTQNVTVWVATGLRHPWPETWPNLMHL